MELGAEVAVVGLHLLDDLGVLLGFRHYRDGGIVLGGCADHAGSADVDVLDDILELDALLEDGLLERIEVDDDHVDGFDALVLDGCHVVGDVPARKDTCVDLGVKCLDTSVQHLGESCDVGHLDDLDTVLFQKLVCTACGDELHSCGL